MADVKPDAARLLADKIDNQPLSFDWSRLGITLGDIGVIRDALRSLADQVEQWRSTAKAEAEGNEAHFAEVQRLADQVERLSAMVRGRERFIEGDSIGRVDFDELCNRVVTREWNALDCELLAGYAQGAYDCMNKYDALKAQVDRLEADKRRLDWLEEMSGRGFYVDVHGSCLIDNPKSWCVLCWGDGGNTDATGVPVPDGPWSENFESLRAAIDAAMKGDGDE